MRKLLIICGLVSLAASATKAQEARGFEVSGTYQYVRFNPGDGASGFNCQGGSGSAGAYLNPRIGIIGEFGACRVTGTPSGTSAHELNYLFGPRVYFPTSRGRVFPFVQALFGGERFTAGASGQRASPRTPQSLSRGWP